MKYMPYDSKKLPRYEGIRSFMRLPALEDMPENLDFAVVGVPLDGASTFESGQRMGPNAIRCASVNCRNYHPELDVDLFEYLQGIDFGDAPMVPGYIEDCYDNIEKKVDLVCGTGAMPVCLGGDHAITLPILRAVAKIHGPLSLLHFDAHYDNNPEYFGKKYNHGTWVYHAVKEGLIDPKKSIQLGMRGSGFKSDRTGSADLGIKSITGFEMHGMGLAEAARQANEIIGSNKVFCSFDIDFIDPSCAPGTGTIEPAGFTSYEALSLFRSMKSMNFVGIDLVEVLPALDTGGITANLAAYILYDYLAMAAWRKKKGE